MKKFVVCAAVAALVAFAAPAFAAINPFMDVPMNHWAYDAIGQLAAKGILSGYPDGTYKGKQPTTRYEMASALARALANVDMTKASKQDVEMLKKLVVEFKDELDALGVRVDQLDKRVAVIEDRLGGWKISGVLRLDLGNITTDIGNGDDESKGFADVARARLFLDRWFGEDESIHFHTRFEGADRLYGGSASARELRWTRWYADFPVWWDARMTAGRFLWDMEADYYLDGTTGFSKFMGMGNDSWLTDRVWEGIGLQKDFGIGKFSFYVAHPELDLLNFGQNQGLWEFFLMGQLQFSEQLGFDIGGQMFVGDDTAELDNESFNNLWTVFAGLRFDFTENVALKGMFYYQDKDIESRNATTGNWTDAFGRNGMFSGLDSDATAWRAIIDIKQDLLQFSSLWIEYDQIGEGFTMPTGVGGIFNDTDFGGTVHDNITGFTRGSMFLTDVNIIRIAAQQNWNDKWSTFLFYANYDVDVLDANVDQFGLGVAYQYNPNVGFGLSYNHFTYDDEFNLEDQSLIRFRTQVTF